jgi:hypothetical protein
MAIPPFPFEIVYYGDKLPERLFPVMVIPTRPLRFETDTVIQTGDEPVKLLADYTPHQLRYCQAMVNNEAGNCRLSFIKI